MKFILNLSHVLVICTLFWKPSDSAELSSVPYIFLKPIMYFHRMVTAPMTNSPDYICVMTPEGKDQLCKIIFTQKNLMERYKVQYDEQVNKTNFDFNCDLRAFNCYINNYLHLGLSQDMLLCPVVDSETKEPVKRYYLSTNYTPDKVILFEAGKDGKVVAVVGVYDINMDDLHKQYKTVQIQSG